MPSQIEVAQVVAMIGSAYPNFSPTKETVSVYFEMLKDLPLDLLRAATMQTCAEAGRKFAPSVGEIRGAVGDLLRQAQKIPSALEAWEEVCQAPKSEEIREVTDDKTSDGAWIIRVHSYHWKHPLVERIAKQFGFPNFPNEENLSVDRAHFFKMYESALQTAISKNIQLPEVRALIANPQLKQLTERLSK